MISKIQRRNKIKTRIRGKVSGTAARPRMTVFRSNKQIYVQLVDDQVRSEERRVGKECYS